MRGPVLTTLALLASHASAQEAQDFSGPAVGVDHVAAPLLNPSGRLLPFGHVAGGLAIGYADAPALRLYEDGTDVVSEEVLAGVLGAQLSAGVGVHDRVSVGLSAPLFVSAKGTQGDGGATLGDLSLQVPVSILGVDDDGLGLALAAIPSLRLPTGDAERLLGSPGVGGGLDLAAGLHTKSVGLGVNAGVGLNPGAALRAGGWVAVMPAEGLSMTVESRLWQLPIDFEGRGLPVEVLGGVRYRMANGAWLGATGGGALSEAPGSSPLRFVLAGGWTGEVFGQPEPEPPPVPSLVARAVDGQGHVVRGAAVWVDGHEVGRTDHEGRLDLGNELAAGTRIEVRRPGYEPAQATVGETGVPLGDLVLAWKPVRCEVRVFDTRGKILPANVVIQGEGEAPRLERDDVGTYATWLPVGDWVLDVESEGMGGQQRTIRVEPGRQRAMRVAVVLFESQDDTELSLEVQSPDGRAVEDAYVVIGGVPIGTTGSGGAVTVRGLKRGSTTIDIESSELADSLASSVDVGDEPTEAKLTLDWLPGSVKVRALGPDGWPTDALVALTGPTRLPPSDLGPSGERVFVLRPGTWTLVLSSPALGLQEREFVVPDNATSMIEMAVMFGPDEGGSAELAVQVLTPEGTPVPGAAVFLGQAPIGTTSNRGTVRMVDLVPGPRTVRIEAPGMRDLNLDLDLHEGVQERKALMGWKPGTIDVQTIDPRGQPVDALVLLNGPAPGQPIQLGDDGYHRFALDPGTWEMVVSTTDYGMQSRDILVRPEDIRRSRVDVRLDKPVEGGGQLVLTVIGPDTVPVDGADVALDGKPLGTTSSLGTLRVSGLAPGPRKLAVHAPALQPMTVEVDLQPSTGDEGDVGTAVPVEPQWAPGALRVSVEAPDGPLTEALVALTGPRPVPPQRPDIDGRALFELDPGDWQVLVSSTEFGMVEKSVFIPEDAVLTKADFKLRPPEDNRAVLLLWVRDSERRPLAGAGVFLGDTKLGTTSRGGALLMDQLPLGEVSLRIEPPVGHTGGSRTYNLRAGSQERFIELPWQLARTTVTVTNDANLPAQAEVVFEGPEVLKARQTGPSGTETFALRPGTWHIYASAPDFAPTEAVLQIEPGQEQAKVDIQLERAQTRIEGNKIVLDRPLIFPSGTANLVGEAPALIDEVARRVLANASIVRLEIQGHTDDVGGITSNKALSDRRANAVRDALIARGVPPERLVSRGYGVMRPITDNSTRDARAKNRRVDFVIAEFAE